MKRNAREGMHLDQEIDFSCVDCNDCCTVFDYIRLSDYEAQELSRLTTRVQGNNMLVDGGCDFHTNKGCAIYDKPFRPRVCKTYICYSRLAELFLEGKSQAGQYEVLMMQAHQKINQITGAYNELAAKVQTQNGAMKTLRGKAKELNDLNIQLQNKNSQLDSTAQKFIREKSNLLSQSNSLTLENDQLKVRVKSYETENQSIRKELSQLKDQLEVTTYEEKPAKVEVLPATTEANIEEPRRKFLGFIPLPKKKDKNGDARTIEESDG